ncbi:hypothetical protein ENH_00073970 [Eimeria necatrix]|uniref:Uncharacterized protein n=1 Tax=Eimeria necatrix TaxID=51315 RepID=U6N7B4_9EIME|nr:hypothetical protein ENH_00073970 [Eimeria necatrix]CDJ69791.1 hypothetical protein ENH_00073970 [Eimeria necatrix]
MVYRAGGPSSRCDLHPLPGDGGPSPPATSSPGLGASSGSRKMQPSGRDEETPLDNKPLKHPQKWAL